MKKILFVGLLIQVFSLKAVDLSEIRKSFHNAVLDKSQIEIFYSFIKSTENTDPVVKAYQGVAEALMAQVSWNPITKLNYVQSFTTIINASIDEHPDNLEIRFLRFAVQFYLPKFLGMSKNMAEDEAFILGHLTDVSSLNIDPFFIKYITYFMQETGCCSEADLKEIEVNLTLNQQY
ncbi:MAG: hypothetical protein KI790_00695 [Cyclobacteriaceae bacterium]|nr:hypothetical protein [Cyclobacteriaceae bacterium HetDA_MAG_MS6]